MGSMIHLSVGELKIDWGKNRGFFDHSPLFQTEDVTSVPYWYVNDDGTPIVEYKQGYSRTLKKILPRLDLLGCTLNTLPMTLEDLFDSPVVNTFIGQEILCNLCLDDILEAFKYIKIDQYIFEKDRYIDTEVILSKALLRTPVMQNRYDHSQKIESLLRMIIQSWHPWLLLKILAQNPDNLYIDVIWDFADVVENGWVGREEVIKNCQMNSNF
jgi:HEPN/Toprim N-terminal domain 1